MRKIAAVMLAGSVASACTTTQYRMRGDQATEIRFSGKRAGEQTIRTVNAEISHHFFLFGFIPSENPVDLTRELRLKPGQALVNARLENSFNAVDALITFGLGLVTLGISPIIWTTRTTTVRGDLVSLNPEATPPAEKAASQAGAGELPVEWKWQTGAYAQADAASLCAKAALALPTRAELKALRETDRAAGKGDVWTADSQADDAWSFSFDSGATFLKDPGEALAVVCVDRGGDARP